MFYHAKLRMAKRGVSTLELSLVMVDRKECRKGVTWEPITMSQWPLRANSNTLVYSGKLTFDFRTLESGTKAAVGFTSRGQVSHDTFLYF